MFFVCVCWVHEPIIHNVYEKIIPSITKRSQGIHYNDVIMTTTASQITSLTVVYSTVYSDADQRKHQSSALLAFVRGIHRGPVNSPHKGPVARKMFPFDDVIMGRSWRIRSNPAWCEWFSPNLCRCFLLYVGAIGRFTNDFLPANQIRWKHSLAGSSVAGRQIAANFCTCHDSKAVVPCTKFCSDHCTCIKVEVRMKRNFYRIWISMGKALVKLVTHCNRNIRETTHGISGQTYNAI